MTTNNTYMYAEMMNTEFTNDYLIKKLNDDIHRPSSLLQVIQNLFR